MISRRSRRISRQEARAALKKAVSDYYVQNQGRGQYSDLDVYLRHDTVHYFMVYLSDYPDTFVGYDDAGALDRHPQTPAFDVVFRFDESCGHLDLYAEGPKQLRRDLETIFGQTALAEDLSLEPPPGAAFQLDHLKDPVVRVHHGGVRWNIQCPDAHDAAFGA